MEKQVVIETRNVRKTFPGVVALDGINLRFKAGEVHAIIGENGAGKSTLMNILSGVYAPDSGSEVRYKGSRVEFRSTADAAKCQIAMIHQENSLVKHLTVYENIYLGHFIKKGAFIDKRAMRESAAELLKKMHIDWIKPGTLVNDLSASEQQLVEIAKALSRDPETIIFDEPTASLTVRESQILMDIIRELRDRNVAIVFISHHLEELFEIADVISVLRDGTYIGTKKIPETNMNEIVKMMIGREIRERYPKRDCAIGDEVFRVEGLTKEGVFHDVDFSVKAGEVLGVSGLMGAGRTEIMQAVFGNLPYDRGSIFINGKQAGIKNPLQAIEHGIGFITEDRKTEGLLLEESIEKNVSLTNLGRISGKGKVVISREKEKGLVTKAIEELHIRCFGPGHECVNLSGGNQQKVVFAKWIYTEPRILILDEPTRGVDIGAKKEIYSIINQLAEKGVAIIMVSSELPEVLGMSDRIMVVREGMVRGIINQGEADQEKIMTLATGGTI